MTSFPERTTFAGAIAVLGGGVARVGSTMRRRPDDRPAQEKRRAHRRQMAVAVRPGQDDLLETVDDFLARKTANGGLNRLYRKWLDADLPAMK